MITRNNGDRTECDNTDCIGHYNALLLINHNHNNFPKSESFIWKIPLRAILWRIGWKITHISHSISELKIHHIYMYSLISTKIIIN